MIDWLYNLTPGALTLFFCTLFLLITWGGTLLIRPLIRIFLRGQPGFNGILGNFLSIFGLFYGILLGLLSVAAYQKQVQVEEAINDEVATLVSFFRNSTSLTGSTGEEIPLLLRDYSRFVIDVEWQSMRRGEFAQGGREIINRLESLMRRLEPNSTREQIVYAEAISQLNRFLELRARRIYSATTGIPGSMWSIVLFGAVLNITLMLLFDMRLRVHFVLGGMLALFIGAVVALILTLDQPLRGEHGIAPTTFELLYDFMGNVIHDQGLSAPEPPNQ